MPQDYGRRTLKISNNRLEDIMTDTPALGVRPAARTAVPATQATAPGRAMNIALWVAQAALTAQFAGAGIVKVTGDRTMVDMFTSIGAGQWLRYVVGGLELAGAVGLLVPRLCGLAAVGLAVLMVGAIVTNVAVLGTDPWLPIGLFLVSTLVAGGRRARITALLQPSSAARRPRSAAIDC
jgi:uncharacterized membrane protein YphA (DoxX/SURF4 family)